MRRFMLLAGMGVGLVAADACSAGPPVLLALVAARNAAATVPQLIEAGHDVDGRDARGATPLMAAARTGAVEAMIALLDAGADPDARDGFNHWTPLLHAIHKRQAGAVGLLLERLHRDGIGEPPVGQPSRPPHSAVAVAAERRHRHLPVAGAGRLSEGRSDPEGEVGPEKGDERHADEDLFQGHLGASYLATRQWGNPYSGLAGSKSVRVSGGLSRTSRYA